MATPVGDYTHSLQGLQNFPNPAPIRYVAPAASTDVAGLITGRCAHLNASKQFELGAKILEMPIFLYKGATSLDVSTSSANTFGAQVFPTGHLMGLVATGGFEFETTEFDTSDTSYAPNDPLHSPTMDQCSSNTAQAGLLYKHKNWTGGGGGTLTLYTDLICGIVSSGTYTNKYRVAVLAFWSVYLPGTA